MTLWFLRNAKSKDTACFIISHWLIVQIMALNFSIQRLELQSTEFQLKQNHTRVSSEWCSNLDRHVGGEQHFYCTPVKKRKKQPLPNYRNVAYQGERF